MITLEPIRNLKPATYNPRVTDPKRLALVELSLRKLGWLLPVYATEDGEILSGHQRTFVAKNLGYQRVPVERIEGLPETLRKAVNILFNRSTNDMSGDSLPERMTAELFALETLKIADQMPDYPIDRFPCLEATQRPIEPYVKANHGRWIPYPLNVAKSLWGHGILMPVIVDSDGIVVNGIGRLQMMAEKGISEGFFITLTREHAEFARPMLNLLSMDFALEAKYADLLRYNSFRRARRVRKELGRGFVFALIRNQPSKSFDIYNSTHRSTWIAKFGRTVIDFGAGHLHETTMLRDNGIDVTSFEPYRLGPKGEIDKGESIQLAKEFLKAVENGTQWSSIFISSVLNSVPFEQDRRHILKICAACCSPDTVVYAVASSEKQSEFRTVTSKYLSETNLGSRKTLLNYEPNVMLGEMQAAPKIQKYHTPKMFYDLFKSAFQTVRVNYDSGTNVSAIAKTDVGVDGLREALTFEFDLPYPDGRRMGLVETAIQAFERRLGTKL